MVDYQQISVSPKGTRHNADSKLMKAMTSSSSNMITPRAERSLTRSAILAGSETISSSTGNASNLEMRKRKLNSTENKAGSTSEQRKKPRLSTTARKTKTASSLTSTSVKTGIKREQPCSPTHSPAASPPHRSQIPRLTKKEDKPDISHRNKSKFRISDWISAYQDCVYQIYFIPTIYLSHISLCDIFFITNKSWSDSDQKEAINQLIESSHPKNVRYMREGFILYL